MTTGMAVLKETARTPYTLERLSPQELHVLELMAEAYDNTAIASLLFIQTRTVESHITSLFAKLGVHLEDDRHSRVLAVVLYLTWKAGAETNMVLDSAAA